MTSEYPKAALGRVFSNQDLRNGLDLRSCVEECQVIVLRGLSLEIDDQLELTRRLGAIEESWEDRHPNSKYLQLMDSRQQKRIGVKSSSKYWHLDRSFMPSPTRFTVLHARQIGEGARGTQFLDSRQLIQSLPVSFSRAVLELEAEHDFSLRFPEIMGAKGISENHVSELRRKYPPSNHPLVMKTCFGSGLYFSELCTSRILGVSLEKSDKMIAELSGVLNNDGHVYEHIWQPHDTLIWDNFATIHRARPDGDGGVRVLHRSTAS